MGLDGAPPAVQARAATAPARTAPGWAERLLAGLLVVGLLLALASLVLPRLPGLEVLRDPAQPWVVLLDVRDEGSVHTWFNVALLTASAGAASLVATVHRRAGRPAWPWWVVAAVLAALSVDDMLSLHERLELLGERWATDGAVPHFAWVLPGAALALVLLLLLLLAARRLPPPSRGALLAGLGMLLLAAVALEAVGGLVISVLGDGAAYILVSHVEEAVESAGACVLAYGVLRGLRWLPEPDGLRLVPAG